MRQQILEAMLRECSRGSVAYRTAALEALGKIYTYSDYDGRYFVLIYDILRGFIAEVSDGGKYWRMMSTIWCFISESD